MADTYRRRLRVEGLTLAAAGVAGSALLLATEDQARRNPLNTVAQLAALAGGLAVLGRRSTAKAIESADHVRRVGDGEPTPLWHVPVPVVAGTLFFSLLAKPLNDKLGLPERLARDAGWDAGLRFTAGSAMVGLYQAFAIERQVEQAERFRTYYRMPGSSLAGTRLGWTRRLGRAGRG